MGTILASQTIAAGATVTSGAFPYSVYDSIQANVLNGATGPTQTPQLILQLSPDNVNYTNVERRTCGMQPNQAYYHEFPLNNYAGWSPSVGPWGFLQGSENFIGTTSGLIAGAVNSIQSCKLQIVNPGTVAVTASATDGCSQNLAVFPLTATSATTGGAVGAWAPPGGQAVAVTRVIIYVSTASTGAASLAVGVAASKTTSNAGQIAAGNANAVGLLDSQNGLASAAPAGAQICATGSYVTFTGSATTAGMVATAYIYYVKP